MDSPGLPTSGVCLHVADIRYFWLIAALAAAMGLIREPTPQVRAQPPEAHR